MKAGLMRADEGREYETDERCRILELCNSSEDADVSVARARVAPGITTKWHRLNGTAERYVILSGCGLAEIGNLPAIDVAAGDVVVIPPGFAQRIRNTGARDLVFLCICTPRFQWRDYESLE